ncbi:DUF2550 family protein [Nostocoides sp.]|uniref:DUF2550 family protein n=1 Tax=Nostocoides sp. TaxID=1917966 RepID=UPI002C3E403B|nr:DUF2550 family protein [Tetrasphaera sp.]
MGLLEVAELVLGLLLLSTLLVLGFIWVRRQIISGGKPLMLCALRTSAQPTWRIGLLRIGASQLDWFAMIGPSFRSRHTWERVHLALDAPRATTEVIPALGESLTASAINAGQHFDIAMEPSGLTALRAWLESQPPGVEGHARGQFT